MEYIRFETDELNEYFVRETGKADFTIEDIKNADNRKFIISNMKITQKDLDALSKINDKKMLFEEIDFSGLDFGECNYSEVVFRNCNLNDAKMQDIKATDAIIEIDDCTGITTEQLTKLKESCSADLKFRVADDVHYEYDIEQFSAIISVMEEIKEAIPENSTDLEKFLFVYNVLGKNIEYDDAGNRGEEFYTEEAEKSTRSLMGTLIKGKGVCVGYSLALAEVSKYIGLEVEKVGGEAYLSDGRSGGHAWNRVKIDGQWYYADLTWDYKHLDKLEYCLKTEEEFNKEHALSEIYKEEYQNKIEKGETQEVLEDVFDSLFRDDESQKESKAGKKQEEVDDLFGSLFGDDEVHTQTETKRIYATESYNPEIVRETMQSVNSWAELENALARIDALKKNGNNLSTEQRVDLSEQMEKLEDKFELSDINSAISTVCLDNYKNVQQAIKDAREDKEYEQTK